MYEQLKIENQICFRLYTASRLLTQAYHPLLDPLGLTYPQYLVMMVLWEKDNQLVGDISHKLLLETNTITPLLQRMERQGLLVRSRGAVDGRQTLVSLTRKGRQLEEEAKEVPACITRDWQTINPDDLSLEQLRSLAPTLDALISILSNKNHNP